MDEKLKGLPVIAVTAYATKRDEEKYINIGCDGYMSKPIDSKKLQKMKMSEVNNLTKSGAGRSQIICETQFPKEVPLTTLLYREIYLLPHKLFPCFGKT